MSSPEPARLTSLASLAPPPEHSPAAFAVRGVALLVALAAPAAIVLVASAARRGEPGPLAGAVALMAAVAAAGAAGGLTRWATRRLGGAWTVSALSWGVSAGATLLVLAICAADVARASGADVETIATFSSPAVAWTAVVAAALFGAALARGHSPMHGIGARSRSSLVVLLLIGVMGVVNYRNAHDGTGSTPATTTHEPTQAESRAALPRLQAAARSRPNDVAAQRELAHTLMRLERYDEALPVYERVAQLAPYDATANFEAGRALLSRYRFDLAEPYLRTAVRLEPNRSSRHVALGAALAAQRRYPEAEAELRAASHIDPDDVEIAGQYAYLLFEMGERDRALAMARRTTRLDSTDGRGFALIGVILRSGGTKSDLSAARAELQHGVDLDRSGARLWDELAVTDYLLDDAPRAAREFAECARLDSTFFTHRSTHAAMWRRARSGLTGPIEDLSVPIAPGTLVQSSASPE